MSSYKVQVVQTDRKTPTVAHVRNGTDSITFWPRLQTLATLPVGNEQYRKTTLSLTTPKKVDVNGVPELQGFGIFDLTAKFNTKLSQAEIDASYTEFLKVLALPDVKKAICEQSRVIADLTTPV